MSFRTAARYSLLVLLNAPVAGQAPREVPIGRPTASHPGEFTLPRSVRELADGSILVADPIEGTLQRLDRTMARATAVGRTGAGPGEYKQPDAVWPLPGDSTLLVDIGNNRLTVIHPDGRLGSTRVLAEPSHDGRLTMLLPSGMDRSGRLYYRGGTPDADSLPVMRFDRRSGQATQVAMLKGPAMNQNNSGDDNNRRQVMAPVPMAPADGWGVGASGRIYLVRVADYHVDVINADGSRVSGPRVPYTPVRITAADRTEYAANQRRGGALTVSMEISNGEPSLSLGRGRLPDDAPTATNFPATKPAFDPAQIWVDGRERLWVRRHQPADQAALYDVFNERGSLVGSVRLGSNRRVVGMGAASVYVARSDEDDLQYLERYALPL